MLDLLAAIVSEPAACPLWGLLLFAAGMYPVGVMLGSSCSPCCNQNPCTLCTSGQLPETVTATLSGFPDSVPVQGPDLITLSFSSCYGSGATAQVTAPAGDPATDKGPISAVSLTSGGSGYAKLGRVAPTLTISGGSGTGATFTPTLTQAQDECNLDYWSVAAISASGGTGYENGDSLTITPATNDHTQVSKAEAKLYIDKSEPTISLDGAATSTVALAPTPSATWVVSSVTISSGGTGYEEGEALTFSKGVNDVEVTAAAATARVVHDEPANAVLTINSLGGSGAVLTPVWELLSSGVWPAPHKKTYRLVSVTVVNGGSGYADYDTIAITFPSVDDGTVIEEAYIDCDIVGAGGVIQQIYIADGDDINTPTPAGRYVGSRTDALDSVALTSAGEYYEDDPGARYVVVESGGSYYREDASEPPYIADVTITVADSLPSQGTGASLSVEIDSDTASETFGQVTGITIENGGSSYLAWAWVGTELCCGGYLNGTELVLQKDPANPCRYTHIFCGGYRLLDDQVGSARIIQSLLLTVTFNGEGVPATASLSQAILGEDDTGPAACSQSWVGDSPASCADFSMTATNESGAAITVTSGGDYSATAKYPSPYSSQDSGPYNSACHVCCRGEEASPEEIEVEVTDTWQTSRPAGLGDFSGTYILSAFNPFPLWWVFTGNPTNDNLNPIVVLNVRIRHEACEQACSQCPPKCEVQIEATLYYFYGANNSLFVTYNFSSIGGQEDQCGYCVETPICSPIGRSGAFGDSLKTVGTVTIQ